MGSVYSLGFDESVRVGRKRVFVFGSLLASGAIGNSDHSGWSTRRRRLMVNLCLRGVRAIISNTSSRPTGRRERGTPLTTRRANTTGSNTNGNVNFGARANGQFYNARSYD